MKKMSGFSSLQENTDTEDDAMEQDLIGMALANVFPNLDIPNGGEDSPATSPIPNNTDHQLHLYLFRLVQLINQKKNM